jgi:hypothetical protein
MPLFAVNLTLEDLKWDYFKFNDGKILLRLPSDPKKCNGKYYKIFKGKWLGITTGTYPISDLEVRELRKTRALLALSSLEKDKNKIIYQKIREISDNGYNDPDKGRIELDPWIHVSRSITCYFEKPLRIFIDTSLNQDDYKKNPEYIQQRIQEDDAIFEAVLSGLFQMKGHDGTKLEIIRLPERVIDNRKSRKK